MPMSTDVILQQDHEAVFPPVCCRCLSENADHTVKFSGRRFSWWQVFFIWLWWLRKPVRLEVPCCAACRPSMRRRRWLELVVYVGLATLSFAILMPWLKSIGANRQWQKIGVFLGVMVLGIPFFIWTVVRPPAFDLTVGDDIVEYEFGNTTYARMFADANPGYRSDDLDWEAEFEDEFEREWRAEHGDESDDESDDESEDESDGGNGRRT